jgi:hypothetical protein
MVTKTAKETMDTDIYGYMGKEYARDELCEHVEAQAAGLDPDQWIGGEFNFDDWLIDSILVGTIEKVDRDE